MRIIAPATVVHSHGKHMSTKKHADSKSGKASDTSPTPEAPPEQFVEGPMSDDAVHATESTVDHPLGKARHGGRAG